MNNYKIINCSNPTSAQDVATKNYVDNYLGIVNTLADGSTSISVLNNKIDMKLNNTTFRTIE